MERRQRLVILETAAQRGEVLREQSRGQSGGIDAVLYQFLLVIMLQPVVLLVATNSH